MPPRIGFLAFAIGFLPLAASAQDGLRSASLPERNVSSPLRPLREDVFLATADTYRPHPDRIPFLPALGFFGPQLVYPVVQPVVVVIPRDVIDPARVAPPPVLPPPLAPYVAGEPGRPKTFYMIPGCYAGDRRPEPDTLKPGCNISRLRVVPPRP